MTAYSVPLPNRLARRVLRPVLRIAFKVLSRVEMQGRENIPAEPYLLVFNHVSLFDAPLILAFWPTFPEVLGASDVWERPGQNILASLYGGIPIDRGVVDRTALHRSVAALRSGRTLLVSPEGTRSGKPGMQQAKSGLAYILDKTGVPILPVGVTGATPDFLQRALKGERPRLNLQVGHVFTLPTIDPTGKSNAEARQEKVDLIMRRIADLLPPEYRGVYA